MELHGNIIHFNSSSEANTYHNIGGMAYFMDYMDIYAPYVVLSFVGVCAGIFGKITTDSIDFQSHFKTKRAYVSQSWLFLSPKQETLL